MAESRGKVSTEPPWHSLITIDFLWHVLKRSFFHWFIAWMIPLSLIALGHSVHTPIVRTSCIYAGLIDLITVFFIIDDRIANGSPNPVNIADEIVVITGGANGLGLVMAQMLGMKGASVAVLDVAEPAEVEVKGVTFIKCDVSNEQQVSKAAQDIQSTLGPVTALINNAGVVNAQPLWQMTGADRRSAFDINTQSHFLTIKAFLPSMLTTGHGSIITISSVLGRLGCANLSAYTSSKAALIAMHASLRSDLQALTESNPAMKNITTVLVTPGQLNTRMFSDVTTPNSLLAPLVEPVELAREIVRYIEEGRSGEVCMPLYTRFIPWLDSMPSGMREVIRWASGMDRAMAATSNRRESDVVEKGATR